ncbi:Phosphopantetheine attachment site [Paenibacillus sp. CF095]|uniref:acyl carrier protein n=1 Tax=Paenibacillus sp. CF095 TaxID=1881033 RepID=UPI000880A4EC|nr:phosphopantetheine-binding protein [Paenibacillus sp. CF095]SDD50639.1 Phosphopantetheine attachment site [Paenibacillus sp. CF095]
MDEKKTKLKKYLARFFRKHEIQDDDNIFELGIVNSLFAMQLVMFVESELEVPLENSELDMKNFRSINAIMELIESKT